jgi:hypothetical protein
MNRKAQPRPVYLDRVLGGIAMLALHEASSVQGHVDAALERLRLAREARGLRQLLREQVDLLPEERNRWHHDQQVRRALWQAFVRDLRATPG